MVPLAFGQANATRHLCFSCRLPHGFQETVFPAPFELHNRLCLPTQTLARIAVNKRAICLSQFDDLVNRDPAPPADLKAGIPNFAGSNKIGA